MERNGNHYFDYSATTPVDPRVLEKMYPFFSETFGNPSSIHFFGQKAEDAVEKARSQIAQLLNCKPDEIFFTSCGTESDNLALRGTAFAARETRSANHILISPVEHHAVTHTAKQLAEHFGFELEYLPVDRFGIVDPSEVQKRLRKNTAIASILYANNEIGTINPISEIGELCRNAGIPFHTDAVQAGAYLSLNVTNLNVDLMALGAHKFYGPKGVGVLYIRSGTPILPVQTGGSQENNLRAGTHNVPYLFGFAEALQIAQSEQQTSQEQLVVYRDQIIRQILEGINGAYLTGHPTNRLPNHASFVFENLDGNTLLMLLDQAGLACSSGSACKTGNPSPSDVLLALGLEPELALGSLRISMGRWTTADQVIFLLETLPDLIKKCRGLRN
jgi:cysteine desulfurase